MKIKKELNQPELILNAALMHISQKGYANVSLREIANEAGVVLSQLNYYYKNKEGLLKEVVKYTARQYMCEIEDILQNGINPQERMRYLVSYFQDMLLKNPNLFRLLYDLTNMSMWSNSFKNLLNEMYNDLANLIEKYILNELDNPLLNKVGSTKTLAHLLFGSLFGISIQYLLSSNNKELLSSMNLLDLIILDN